MIVPGVGRAYPNDSGGMGIGGNQGAGGRAGEDAELRARLNLLREVGGGLDVAPFRSLEEVCREIRGRLGEVPEKRQAEGAGAVGGHASAPDPQAEKADQHDQPEREVAAEHGDGQPVDTRRIRSGSGSPVCPWPLAVCDGENWADRAILYEADRMVEVCAGRTDLGRETLAGEGHE